MMPLLSVTVSLHLAGLSFKSALAETNRLHVRSGLGRLYTRYPELRDVEVPVLFGYEAVSPGSWFPTLRDSVAVTKHSKAITQ